MSKKPVVGFIGLGFMGHGMAKNIRKAGYELHVVSNQGCVSRGMITKATLDKFTKRMLGWIKKEGGKIRKVFYCPHQSSDGCRCKKPETLMMERAVKGRR